jgi:hypothetical protein
VALEVVVVVELFFQTQVGLEIHLLQHHHKVILEVVTLQMARIMAVVAVVAAVQLVATELRQRVVTVVTDKHLIFLDRL